MKERLKKEAEDFLQKKWGISEILILGGDAREVLADFVEPREKRIAILEKENTELKAQLENDRDLPTIAYMQGAEKQKKKDTVQLTYAKELLAKWVELFKPKGGNIPPTPIQVVTEQFLNSEVEDDNETID